MSGSLAVIQRCYMPSKLVLLSKTVLDWDTLLQITYPLLGRTTTRPLDQKNITARGMAEGIVAYGEFQQKGVEYLNLLRDAGSLLKHFSVSFLWMTSDRNSAAQISFDGDLKILDCGDNEWLFIVSASLEQWRTTIINFASHQTTNAQSEFANEALIQFDKMGLGRLWENYSRQKTGPNGVLLTEKR